VYFGGNARLIEAYLGVPGEDILYVGDHVFADVHVTKDVLRWRTALVIRELEQEIADAEAFTEKRTLLLGLMEQKTGLEFRASQLRLYLQRKELGYAQPLGPARETGAVRAELSALRTELEAIDARVADLAKAASELGNRRWGPLLRAGSDKSRMARQLERYADIYTSRVSNLGFYTPFAYLRPPPGTLPHDVWARDTLDDCIADAASPSSWRTKQWNCPRSKFPSWASKGNGLPIENRWTPLGRCTSSSRRESPFSLWPSRRGCSAKR
jgi:hypothetical protein